ncbi:MAG: DUF1311 domain-containing protein [Alphaproteobacteria bacterium]|nr:DUF1311 domain-containing protein [Alphaproteobacteria bacterium]
MQKIAIIAVMLVFGAASPAFAGAGLDCADTSAMNQSEMNACAAQDFEIADAELNEVWPQVKRFAASLDEGLEGGLPTSAEALLKGQKAWLIYRDAQCDLEGYTSRGGSMVPLLVYGCKATLTKERVRNLKSLMSGE